MSELDYECRYVAEWCKRENMTKWCKRMKRERTFWGVYLGVAACYRPNDCTICFGKEYIDTVWFHHREEDAINFLVDVLCHEEDHRAIHEVMNSEKMALAFDLLFGYPFDPKVREEYFRVGEINLFGDGKSSELSAYGKMVIEKLEEKKEVQQL